MLKLLPFLVNKNVVYIA